MADKIGGAGLSANKSSSGNQGTVISDGGGSSGGGGSGRVTSNGSGATLVNNQWTTSSGNAAYHPYGEYYNDGYVKPAGGSSGGGYGGVGAIGDPYAVAAAPAEPVDTSVTKSDLLNADQNAGANKDLLNNSGLDLSKPIKDLNVPSEAELPQYVTLPTTVLPNKLDLPDNVTLPDEFDYDAALARAGDVNIGRVNNVDIAEERAMLNQLTDAQRQQAILQADNTINNGIASLQRNQQNAQEQFTTQQNQIDIDEQRAKDNQALYAEARGDRGGIGAAQYDTIQNTAATNRLMVQKEQTQLATDTARQIADLRAQGEFEKANQLLSISQNYLGQLMNLYQWAKEANIGIDEFNLNVAEWEENYKLSLVESQLDVQNSNLNLAQARVAQAQQQWQNAYQQENSLYNARWNQEQARFQAAYDQENSLFNARLNAANQAFNNRLSAANYGLDEANARINAQLNMANATGAFANGTPTFAAQQSVREVLAASGQALLEKGIIPTAEQLQAMGMTADQAVAFAGGTDQSAGGIGAGRLGGIAAMAAGSTPIITPSSANYSANTPTSTADMGSGLGILPTRPYATADYVESPTSISTPSLASRLAQINRTSSTPSSEATSGSLDFLNTRLGRNT